MGADAAPLRACIAWHGMIAWHGAMEQHGRHAMAWHGVAPWNGMDGLPCHGMMAWHGAWNGMDGLPCHVHGGMTCARHGSVMASPRGAAPPQMQPRSCPRTATEQVLGERSLANSWRMWAVSSSTSAPGSWSGTNRTLTLPTCGEAAAGGVRGHAVPAHGGKQDACIPSIMPCAGMKGKALLRSRLLLPPALALKQRRTAALGMTEKRVGPKR